MDEVSTFYSGPGQLVGAIGAALHAAGMDRGALKPADLAPVDEFHIRGRAATLEIIAALELTADSRVVDLGSGLGGPARTLAEVVGCSVTGVDLTAEFCEVATALSEWTGLDGRTAFQVGDATATGLPDAAFDAAMTVHVAMNIPDKPALYAEAFRLLRPAGRFVVYDVLQGEGGDVVYPVPWANDASTSFLATPEQTREMLVAAGSRSRRTSTPPTRVSSGSARCAPALSATGRRQSRSPRSSATRSGRWRRTRSPTSPSGGSAR